MSNNLLNSFRVIGAQQAIRRNLVTTSRTPIVVHLQPNGTQHIGRATTVVSNVQKHMV